MSWGMSWGYHGVQQEVWDLHAGLQVIIHGQNLSKSHKLHDSPAVPACPVKQPHLFRTIESSFRRYAGDSMTALQNEISTRGFSCTIKCIKMHQHV
jgi:hypothetical protein